MDSRCGCSWSMTTHSSVGRCVSRARARATPFRKRNGRREALARLETFHPDVVILDLVLPDLSGFDVCREIRRAGHRMPVIILSAKHDEIDVVLGLEIGADDYIAKPFRPRELLARIGAHLRKAKELRGEDKPADGRLVFRDLVIDTAERRVTRAERDIVLTHTEFDLLSYLASNAGKVLSRERILSAVWGYEHPIETRVIDVHVRNLRRKIEPEPAQPRHILAVPGHRLPIRRAQTLSRASLMWGAAKYTRHRAHILPMLDPREPTSRRGRTDPVLVDHRRCSVRDRRRAACCRGPGHVHVLDA